MALFLSPTFAIGFNKKTMRKSMITLNRKWIRLIGIVGCTMCLASCKQASDASGMKPSYATMKVEATDKELSTSYSATIRGRQDIDIYPQVSVYNTPPCYNIYICGKVFKWIKKMGGLSAMKEHNEKKAKILYDFLDESRLFKGTVVKEDRSLMNVPFVTGDKELDAKFVEEATKAGFVNLKGHRTVGGMRASIYNAMPIEGVEKLVEFMKKFEKENTK